MQSRVVTCYAEGRENDWQAICLDFDLAVQGHTFDEVYSKLNDQIVLYVQTACSAPEHERQMMLSRSVPWTVRLSVAFKSLRGTLLRGAGSQMHANYDRMIDGGAFGAAA